MVARVTLAEIDAVRTSIDGAVRRFEETVAPELESQDGYEGCYVLTTPHGKALVMTFWRDAEAAEAEPGQRALRRPGSEVRDTDPFVAGP